MKGRSVIAAAAALLPCLLAGCFAPLEHSIHCEEMLSLRIGQTGEDVRKILGEPRLIARGNAVPWYGREPILPGTQWHYGMGSVAFFRDELTLAFHDDRLTWVSAYRKVMAQEGASDAFWLMKDPRTPEKPEDRRLGPAFKDVFPCTAPAP